MLLGLPMHNIYYTLYLLLIPHHCSSWQLVVKMVVLPMQLLLHHCT